MGSDAPSAPPPSSAAPRSAALLSSAARAVLARVPAALSPRRPARATPARDRRLLRRRSSNFSHIIEEEQRPEHQLVTHGVYSCLRHPAYFGYFWWAVGTQAAVVHHGPSPSSPHAPRRAPMQVLLANPVCVCAYAVASFLFFRHRIPYEEHFLVRFFGEE